MKNLTAFLAATIFLLMLHFCLCAQSSPVFKPGRLVDYYSNRTTVLHPDTTKKYGLYAELSLNKVFFSKCGSVYIFPKNSFQSTFRPAFYANVCSGNLELTRFVGESNDSYIIFLNIKDNYFQNPVVRLIELNLKTGKHKTLDKGVDADTIKYSADYSKIFYKKQRQVFCHKRG